MKEQFKELLHHYKVEAFKISHGNERVQETTEEILKFTDETLNNEYHYHFRNNRPDPQRIETFKMIKNFTVEAILPPVVERLVRRITVLEKQHDELVRLVDHLLETLSEAEQSVNSNAG